MAKQEDNEALRRFRERCKIILSSTSIRLLESKEDKKKHIKRSKEDFKYFVERYFPHYAESETPFFHIRIARKVRRSPNYKGWLKWARAHAKSVVAIVLLPLWLWINDDCKFLLVVGQNDDKAEMLLSDLQAEFEFNQYLIEDFGKQKLEGSWESGFFQTSNGFIGKSLGLGMDPRGARVGPRRPDMIVADDWETRLSVKNPKQQDELSKWFLRSVLLTMDKGNRRVLICQNHFAPRMIFSSIVEENKGWDVDQVDGYNPVTYEVTWKEKYDAQYFKDWEEEIGVLACLAEFNHQPYVEGKNFTDEMIQWSPIPKLKSFEHITGKWDVAYAGTKTADFNAVRVWGVKDGKKYLIDCYVKQSKMNPALQWIADFQKNLPEGVSVQFGFESQFWNDEVKRIISEVEEENYIILNLTKIDRDTRKKYDRIMEMLPQYQNGRIYYNQALKSHNDTQVGIAQLKGIEIGYTTKDDAPDADKYAFDDLDRFKRISSANNKVGPQRPQRKF